LHHAITPEYRALTKARKIKFITQEREMVAQSITLQTFASYGNGVLYRLYRTMNPDLSSEDLIEKYRDEIRYEWVSDFTMGYIQQYYNTSTVIMTSGSPYNKYSTPEYTRVVFIEWVDECHYEPLGYPGKEGLEFVFKNTDSVISKLRTTIKTDTRRNPTRRARYTESYK